MNRWWIEPAVIPPTRCGAAVEEANFFFGMRRKNDE